MPTAHNNSIGFSISGSINGGGIKHFTNWDAGLTSIEFDQKEKFIAKQATEFLTDYTFYDQLGEPLKIKYGADNVKIVDNYAAVSYPEYTDLAKSSFYLKDSHIVVEDDGIISIPFFHFDELETILDKNHNNLLPVKRVDLTGCFIVLHYHNDTLYAGPVEPQVLKYVKPDDYDNEVGTFTISSEGSLIGNIGTATDYAVIKTCNYGQNCCGQPGTTGPTGPTGATGATGSTGCTDAYWLTYLGGEGEGRYIQITTVTGGPEVSFNDYAAGLYNTGNTEEDNNHYAFTEPLPLGSQINIAYDLINFDNAVPGTYTSEVTVYNVCQTGPQDTIQFIFEIGSLAMPLPEINNDYKSSGEPSSANIVFENEPIYGDPGVSVISCDIELIKYKPIIGCGKVDVYYINKGVITDYTNQIATCTNHNLKSGDIIRIFGALDTSNGSYYVDTIDKNTFYIYKNYSGGFLDKLNIATTDDVQFIKIGNVLDPNETTWQLHSSLTSPRGKNGYGATFGLGEIRYMAGEYVEYKPYDVYGNLIDPSGLSASNKNCSQSVGAFEKYKRFWCDTKSQLADCFNKTQNFDQVFARDYGISDAEFLIAMEAPNDRTESIALGLPKLVSFERFPVAPIGPGGAYYNQNIWTFLYFGYDPEEYININPYGGLCDNIVKIRSVYGIYDIWNTAYNLVNNFHFGCSIDFKKDETNNKYLLLVGERGFDTLFSVAAPPTESILDNTANVYWQLPQYGHGAAYLFEIKDLHTIDDNPYNVTYPDHIKPLLLSNRVSLVDYYTAYKNDDEIDFPEPLVSAYLEASALYGYLASSTVSGYEQFIKRRHIFNCFWIGDCNITNPFHSSNPENYCITGGTTPENHPLFLGDCAVVASQDHLNVNWGNIETKAGHEYWYGSMLYSLANINNGSTIYSNNKLTLNPPYYTQENSCTQAYFSNLNILTIPNSTDFTDQYVNGAFSLTTQHDPMLGFRRNSFDVYPYVDNFGKSVALDIVDGDTYVFAASRTKPIINRPQVDGECDDTDLAASYVGYIHVFKNGDKIQKIYETEAITFPSAKWQGSYYKADKFATCMHADKGKLFWGQTKGIELLETDQTWTNEKSKIFIYENQNDVYTKTHTIENYNDRHNSYLMNIDKVPDHKEYHLRNLLSDFANETTTEFTFYPSDRFGSCFKVDKNILVANAFDNQNELNGLHSIENSATSTYIFFNQTLDYLHLYSFINNNWQYVQKIAPAFNKNKAEYNYDSILFPAVNKSVRNLGNITYDNSIENSRTWDIDLTNSFIVADNRIILKDPISYSIFERDFSIVRNDGNFLNLPDIQDLIVNPIQYFTYDEQFSAQVIPSIDDCNELTFTSLNGLYTFNYQPEDYKDVLYKNTIVNDNQYLDIITPVYFVSLPKIDFEFANINSIKFTIEEIIAAPQITNGLVFSELKMLIFTKDPRTTVYPSYLSYNNLCNIDTTNNIVHAKYNSNNIFDFYRGGAFDSYRYTENSFNNNTENFTACNNYLCLAKIFNPVLTTGNGINKVHQFEITRNDFDISSLLIKGDLLLDTANNRSFTKNNITDILEFYDLEKYGYDSSINVENTLIIGFVFNMNLLAASYAYKLDSQIAYLNSGIRINTIEASIRYNFASTPNFIDNNGASLRTYKCILNKVSNFNYVTSNSICFNDSYNNFSIYNDSILLYNKPVLGIGNSNIGLSQTRSEMYEGATTKTLELISLDNYNNTTNELAYTYSRHFNIQPLEYLPLFISGGSRFPYEIIKLYINGPVQITKDSILFIKANEPFNFGLNLHTFGPLPLNEDVKLNIKGHRILTSPYLDGPHLFIRCTEIDNKDATLHMLGFEPVSMSLFVKGPLIKNQSFNLFTKSLEYNNDLNLFMGGFAALNSNINLFIQQQITTNNLNLNIAGPIGFNSGINSKNHICQIGDRGQLFDISIQAESQISTTNKNSISFNKYESKAKQLTYVSKDITNIVLNNDNTADDDFYLTYRDNKSIAANNNYVCVASNVDQIAAQNISYWDGKHIPKISIYSLNANIQVNLVYNYVYWINDLLNIDSNELRNSILNINPDLPVSIYIDASIASVDISDNNNIAVSMNLIVRNISNNTFRGQISCIFILHKNNSNNEWDCINIISQESTSGPLLDMLTGINLQWVGEDLYYTINDSNKLNDAIKVAKYNTVTNTYTVNDINVNFKSTNLYNDNYKSNLNNGYFLSDIHYGFGHKFIIDNDLMFVAAPLVDPYWSNNLAMGSAANSHCGAVFVYKLINNVWTYINTIYNDGHTSLNDATDRSGSFIQRLFGYDLDYSSVSNSLVVSQPLTSNVYKFNIDSSASASLIKTYYNNEIGYGNSVAICNSQLIALSKHDNGILYYGPNDNQNFAFDPFLTDNELSQYLAQTPKLLKEKIINFKTIDINDQEYILVLRKFNITYFDNATDVIQKVSLLNLNHVVNPTLFIQGPITNNKRLPQYISGPNPKNTLLKLYTKGVAGLYSNTTLYIGTLTRKITTLFLKTIDPSYQNKSSTLFIRNSSLPGSIINVNQFKLFMRGRAFSKDFAQGAPLFLQSPPKGYVNKGTTLTIGIPPNLINNNISLFNYGSSSPSIAIDQIVDGGTTLFMSSRGYLQDSNAPLFIQARSGGTNLNLVMFSQGTENNFSLFTNATYGANNNLSFILFSKDATLGINTFIRGYRS